MYIYINCKSLQLIYIHIDIINNKNMNKKAFTIVELIVVIAILAILTTIAFASYQWYGAKMRDSKRLSDIQNIEKIVELLKIQNWEYPMPDEKTNITYSWSVAWTQWVFSQNRKTAGKVLVDPLTALKYSYAVTNSRKEFQVATVLESEVLSVNKNTYAWDKIAQIHVTWNYNGKFLKMSANSKDYLLWVPSILASDINSAELVDIIRDKRFVYDGYNNLPANFSWSDYNSSGWFWFSPNKLVLFEWDLSDLISNSWERVKFLDNLQTNYEWTEIISKSGIAAILEVDSSSDAESSNYVAEMLNDILNTNIALILEETTPICIDWEIPTDESYFTFDEITKTIMDYDIAWWLDVVIPCKINNIKVINIWENSFFRKNLTNIVIPNNVKNIWRLSFMANKLTSIDLPESIVSIDTAAFLGNLLVDINIPDNVTIIWDRAFANNKLEQVKLWKNVLSIWELSFGVNKLKEIIIPNKVEEIKYNAFTRNQLENITFEGNKLTIWASAFSNNNITDLHLPEGIKIIWDGAFRANNITNLDLPDSIEYIWSSAFASNTITTLDIPKNIEHIWDEAFWYNLTSITNYDGFVSNEYIYLSKGSWIEINDYLGPNTNLDIPDTLNDHTIVSIWTWAFQDWGFTNITIPNTVENIGDYAFLWNPLTNFIIPENIQNIGMEAFERTNLTNVTNYDGLVSDKYIYYPMSWWIEISHYIGTEKNLVLPNTLNNLNVISIWIRTFREKNLTSITLPNNIENIGNQAFQRNSITNISLPEGLRTIGVQAFGDSNISNIIIPSTLIDIWMGAIPNANLISATNYDGFVSDKYIYNPIDWWIEINNYFWSEIDLIIPDSLNWKNVISLWDKSFVGTMENTVNIVIPNTVTSIWREAFGWDNLKNITIPDTVTSIWSYAFYYWEGWWTIYWPISWYIYDLYHNYNSTGYFRNGKFPNYVWQ